MTRSFSPRLRLLGRPRLTTPSPAGPPKPDEAVNLTPTQAHQYRITEADADAIRAIFSQEGELSAAIELRRRFPGITDNAKARAHVRTIAGWKPLPSPPCSVVRLRPRKDG